MGAILLFLLVAAVAVAAFRLLLPLLWELDGRIRLAQINRDIQRDKERLKTKEREKKGGSLSVAPGQDSSGALSKPSGGHLSETE